MLIVSRIVFSQLTHALWGDSISRLDRIGMGAIFDKERLESCRSKELGWLDFGGIVVRTSSSPVRYSPQAFLLGLTLLCACSGCQTAQVQAVGKSPPVTTTDAPTVSKDNSAAKRPVILASHEDRIAKEAVPTIPVSNSLEAVSHKPAGVFSGVGLTLDIAEGLAVASHPALAEARSLVVAAQGQYLQAGIPFNPVVQYQSEEIGNANTSGLHSVRISQQFVTADKLGLAQNVRAQEFETRQAEVRLAKLQVLTRVRTAFNRALIAQRRVELTEQIVRVAEKSVASVETLLEAKETSRIALLQARVEAQQARISDENAKTQLEANRRALAAAIGISALPPEPLIGEVSMQLAPTPWEDVLSEIEVSSPELAAAGSELERAKWALQLACARRTPNVTGTLGVGVDTETDDTYAVVGVSVPLPVFNRNQGNIQSARAEVAAASAAIERTRLNLESRLAAAVGRYQTAKRRYEQLQAQVVPSAEETYELSQAAFDVGEASFLELLTTQRTLFATRLTVLDALEQAGEANAQIEGLLVTLD